MSAVAILGEPGHDDISEILRLKTDEIGGVIAGDLAEHRNIARQDRQFMLRRLDQR